MPDSEHSARGPVEILWRTVPEHVASKLAGLGRVGVAAVTGPVGAGKSTLAGLVATASGGVVLATDRYLPDYEGLAMRDRDRPERAHLDELARHLGRLRAGETVDVPVWSFFEHARVGYEAMGPASAVVVEGIFALEPVIRAAVDIAVYIEAPARTRWDRLVSRELAGERGWSVEHMREHYDAVAEPTFAERAQALRASADVIVVNA